MVHFLKEGDIFSLKDVSSYAHGCNCAGAMEKGIALQFTNRYPTMYKEYKLLCQCGQFNPAMSLTIIMVKDMFIIWQRKNHGDLKQK